MSTTIQIKRSSTASAVPLTGDLAVGELAVNLADKRLFAKQADGTIIELSTNPTDLDAATLRIDGVEITASATELNSLDGLTATTAELNILDGVTATATEINVLDGITSTTTELNKLDGFTGSTAELNILDGVTATTAELNFVDGVTSNVQTQLNAKQPLDAQLTDIAGLTPTDGSFIVGNGVNFVAESGNTAIASLGVTATAAELNTLDGVTATATELNYTDGVTSNIQTQLNSMVEKAGDVMTGDLSLGDGVKAKFGASDDLEIYHSGTGSIINDKGTGNLSINTNGANVQITKSFAENIATFNADGAVSLYYDNAKKFDTTSTGVDVTGTITADGLDVRNTSSPARIKVQRDDNTNSADAASIDLLEGTGINADFGVLGSFGYRLEVDGATNKFNIKSGNGASVTNRLSIDRDSGDVSFYEDTGTTAKMVWDASAESLGIGTSAPYGNIHLAGGQQDIVLTNEDADGVAGATIGRFIGQARGWQNEGDEMASIDFETNATSWFKGDIVFKTNNVNGTDSSVNATERMRIDSAGNVGIGTASPSGALDIGGQHVLNDNYDAIGATFRRNGAYGSVIALGRQGVSDGATLDYPAEGALGFGTNGTERARIDSSGNLLVGKTNDLFATVGSYMGANGVNEMTTDGTHPLRLNRKSNDGDIATFAKDGSTVGSIGVYSNDLYIGNDDAGLLFNNASNYMTPHNASTNTPLDATMDIGAGSRRFKDLYLSGGVKGTNLTFSGNNGTSEHARIDSSGNVGIGTSSPRGNLSLGSATTGQVVDKSIHFGYTTTDNYGWKIEHSQNPSSVAAGDFKFVRGTTASWAESARFNNNGNLLIGTTTTGFGNDDGWTKEGSAVVQRHNSSLGNGTAYTYFTQGGSLIGSITQNGTTGINYNTTSDERLKENIKDTTHTVDINDIRVREYDWKADGEHQRFGFIAQELETVYPEAVHSPEDPEEMKSVDYSKLVPLLVKEIQTLKLRIETLENK